MSDGPSTSTPVDPNRWANEDTEDTTGEYSSDVSSLNESVLSFFDLSIPEYDDSIGEPEVFPEMKGKVSMDISQAHSSHEHFLVAINQKERRLMRKYFPRNKRKKVELMEAQLRMITRYKNAISLPDKRRANGDLAETPLPKRCPTFSINTGSNTKEYDPNGTLLNNTMEDLDEDAQTEVLLSETKDEEQSEADKIAKQKQLLQRREELIKRR